jgi:hypothetical protein
LIFDKGGFAYINPAIFHDFFVLLCRNQLIYQD